MKTINIQTLKANFPKYLRQLEHGASFILCRRNLPVAELRPISNKVPSTKKRRFGQHKGWVDFDPELFESSSGEITSLFEDLPLVSKDE